MADQYLRDLSTADNEAVRAVVLQRWLKQTCINGGISIVSADPYLRDLSIQDNEPTRAVVLQRWTTLLANNITSGGGGWPPPTNRFQQGSVALGTGVQSFAVLFSPAMIGVPTFIGVQVQMVNGSSEFFTAAVDLSSVSANGFTFYLSGIPTITGAVAKWTAQA